MKYVKFQRVFEEQGEKLTTNLTATTSPPVNVFLEDCKELDIIYYKDYKGDATGKNREESIDRQDEKRTQILADGEILEEMEDYKILWKYFYSE